MTNDKKVIAKLKERVNKLEQELGKQASELLSGGAIATEENYGAPKKLEKLRVV